MKAKHLKHLNHHINNASTVIIGCADLLLNKEMSEEKKIKMLKAIKAKGQLCAQVVSDLSWAVENDDDSKIGTL